MGKADVPEIVLIFRGTHQVMSAEKTLKTAGVPTKLIPVPKRLSTDCGFAVRIFLPDRDRAREVLSRSGLLPRSVHILREEGVYEDEPF